MTAPFVFLATVFLAWQATGSRAAPQLRGERTGPRSLSNYTSLGPCDVDGWCPSGSFCNHDDGTNDGFCEDCGPFESGERDCANDGLPLEGAEACQSICTGAVEERNITRLLPGQTLSGSVETYHYAYFQYVGEDSQGSVVITLTSLDGADINLYVTVDEDSQPSSSNYDYASLHGYGPDVVTIASWSDGFCGACTYNVAAYGYSGASSTSQLGRATTRTIT